MELIMAKTLLATEFELTVKCYLVQEQNNGFKNQFKKRNNYDKKRKICTNPEFPLLDGEKKAEAQRRRKENHHFM